MSREIRLTFQPLGRVVQIPAGMTVLEAADRVGVDIDAPCGANGQCGKCRVQFTDGAPDPTPEEQTIFDVEAIVAGWRLACCCRPEADAVISVPDSSLVQTGLQIHTDSQSRYSCEALNPPVKLREGRRNLAAAFDLGTTTLVCELLDLATGRSLGVVARVNPQVRFGDDVISRISHALTEKGALELQQIIAEAMNEQIIEVCRHVSADPVDVRSVCVSGNTTMQHLLCRLDVSNLSQLPFEPATYDALVIPSADLGIVAVAADVYIMPIIGGFVGGDTVSGILTSHMLEQSEALGGPVVMIDIGTNGEIVLAHDGVLYASSTAAGPAFEGARIKCGMRATAGAIEKISPHGDDLQIEVIAGAEAVGLCGSALIDAAAILLDVGLLDETGRFVDLNALPAEIPSGLAARMRLDANGRPELLLVAGQDGGDDVVLCQQDIRELQLAAGALRAGVNILLSQAGLSPGDLGRVLIAGGFGSYIRPDHARRIGLIPFETPVDRLEFIGNISLRGAVCAAVNQTAREQAETLACTVKHVELSADLNFQMAFAEAMIFPQGR